MTAFADAYRDFDAQNIDSEKIDADHFFPRDVVKGLGDLGAMGMTIPEEYGGSGFSATAYCKMMEVIGPLDASAAIVVGAHQSIGIKPLLLFGTDEQKKKWLPDLADGEARRRLLPHRAGGGLRRRLAQDDGRLRRGDRRVRPDRDEAVDLERRLREVLHGLRADPRGGRREGLAQGDRLLRRRARTRTGTSPGSRAAPEEKKLGLCASSTCQIVLDDCRVPAFNIIGGKGHGFRVAVETLNTGRTSLGAGAVGGCKQMIKLAVEHATQRKQFKTRIADFEMIREKIAEMTAHTYVLESMVYMTAGLVDKGVRLLARRGLLQGLGDRAPLEDDQRGAPDRRRQRLHERVPVRPRRSATAGST